MPLILGTNSIKDTGFNVANSLRFDGGSTDYLNQTISSSTGKIFTYSVWFKKSADDSLNQLFHLSSDNNTAAYIDIATKSGFGVDFQLKDGSGGTYLRRRLTRDFRDFSSWYHVVCRFDSTQSTASDRARIYVNGIQATDVDADSTPDVPLNFVSDLNTNGGALNIGKNISTGFSSGFDGYMAEVVLIDGQSLDPTSFGEFNSDSPTIWQPIDVSGLTFGTNGFYLDFEDSSALGNDAAGSNNFTVNNLTAIDQTTDTCTNNFATFNPLDSIRIASGVRVPTYSNGNNTINHADSGYYTSSKSTIAVNSGKWYCEAKCSSPGDQIFIGLAPEEDDGELSETYLYEDDGTFGGSAYGSAYGGTHGGSAGDIIQIAFDATNGTVWFGLNGTWQNSATVTEIQNGTTTNAAASGLTMTKFWHIANKGYNGATWNFNFGSPPYAISSGNTDGNGYGNFEYAVPSGYYSLNTKNLSEFG